MTKPIPLKKVGTKSVLIALILVVGVEAASAQRAFTPTSSTQTVMLSGSPKNIRPGHILVRFKATPALEVLNQLNTAFGAKVVGTIAGIAVTHLQVPPEKQFALLGNLRQRPDVEFAEFDSYVQALVTPDDPYYSAAYPTSHYGTTAQWAPQAVSAPSAWGNTGGSRSIVIAVVDTGVDDTHPDLASKIVGEYNFVNGETVHDGFGHGTHVSGIAAAATNNNTGIAGICWNCGILSVKVLNSQGSGTLSDVASGITYAAQHGARVINLSLGGNGQSQTLDSALNYAVANNALPVCAMGNSNSSAITPQPAYWYSCLTVIATNQTGARASFSNYGIKADVSAPGVGVLSTMPTYPVTLTTSYGYYENYDALSGTSMATPMVSGIAGLVLSMNPNLTPAQVKGIIEASAGNGWTDQLGFGLVNAATAVSKAINADTAAPVPNVISPASGATVSGLTTVQAAPTDDTTVHHIDIIQSDSRLMQPLVGVSTSNCTSKKNCTTAPAWTLYWPSTVLWNGSQTVSAIATDTFGGTSQPQSISFTIQNTLVTQTGTATLCYPGTSSCPSSVWNPVTTGASLPAASHLQGTVTYGTLSNTQTAVFWLQLENIDANNNFVISVCGTTSTTVDCYLAVPLQPDANKSVSNYDGGQIDLVSKTKQASGTAAINWTLTYPQ